MQKSGGSSGNRYAKMDKRLFTGAATKLDAEGVKLNGMADISRGLEGRAAGVSVQNVSGTFGTAPKIAFAVLPPFTVAPNHYGWWMELLWKTL